MTDPTVSVGRRSGGLGVRHLWLFLPFVALAFRVVFPITDNSFLWHVRAGQLQLDAGQVLRQDPFSFTRQGEPWRTQSWLLDLMYGWLANLTSGVQWVPAMLFVFGGATLGFVALAAYRWTKDPTRTAVVVLLLTWVGFFFFVPRPVSGSLLLLAVTAVAVQNHERAGWALVPILWLWAAIHGSFPMGIGLVVLEAVRRRSRRLGELAVIGAFATLLTAHGTGTWWIFLQFLRSREALDFLSEWARPDFTNPFLAPYVLFALMIGWALYRRRIDLAALVVVVPFLVFGALAQRSVFPALVVLVPFASAALGERIPETRPAVGNPRINRFLATALLALIVIALARPVGFNAERLPSDEALAELRAGNVFQGPAAGGMLIYAEYPGRLVFMDDRAELFGVEFFSEVVDAVEGEGHEALFAEHQIEQALLKTKWELGDVLQAEGWTTDYEDQYWVVMSRP